MTEEEQKGVASEEEFLSEPIRLLYADGFATFAFTTDPSEPPSEEFQRQVMRWMAAFSAQARDPNAARLKAMKVLSKAPEIIERLGIAGQTSVKIPRADGKPETSEVPAELIADIKSAGVAGAEDEARQVARMADLFEERPEFWAHITQVSGGYFVSTSAEPIHTPYGFDVVPDQHGRLHACGNFDEVVEVLRRRFS